MTKAKTLTEKLIDAHRPAGRDAPAGECALRIDQTLTQDATGTLVMLELEALDLDRVQTECSVQYVDHNLLQTDFKNPDDHMFLYSACQRFGVWFSRAGNGISHPLHMQAFARPGATLLGSDSHTCAGGAVGMLAIGAGGLDVAMAMAGEPFHVPTPEVWGIELHGALPPWVSAKDVVLELLRRHGVSGGVGRVIEYHGPGLAALDVWDRHVIANMGAELGATTSVFPSDAVTRDFMQQCGRGGEWQALHADAGADYAVTDRIDLSQLQPLIATPSSPGNVVPVADVAGEPIAQAYVGSSANPGYRDFATVAALVEGKEVHPAVSLDINPSTRGILSELSESGALPALLSAGARLHQVGCNGCIGMGQAPASGRNSLRTVPRNFPGRSGTPEDSVYLCSPETAAASALHGRIVDPRTLGAQPPAMRTPARRRPDERSAFVSPRTDKRSLQIALDKGPNIASIPELGTLPDRMSLPLALVVGDDISTDEIMPAGARVLPFRSNVERIARFCFEPVDETYVSRVEQLGDHAVVGGDNYGQGSSREHAALAPRHLGLRAVLARSFARIHRQNLIAFGVLPIRLQQAVSAEVGDDVEIEGLHDALRHGHPPTVRIGGKPVDVGWDLSERERRTLRAGGRINLGRAQAA